MSLQVEVLEQSFERVKPYANDFAFSFYQNLLTDYPQLRPLFAKTNMEDQQQKLMMTLTLVVENIRNPSYLKIILKNLGERHVSYRAQPEHYPTVGGALLKTFESYLGKDWTPEVKQAWIDAYEVLATLMLEGANYAEEVHSTDIVIQQHDTMESDKALVQAPANAFSVNSSQEISQLDNSSKPSTKPVENNKVQSQVPANAFSVNSSQEISQLDNSSRPSTKPVESSEAPNQATATTSMLDMKLLLIISVIASLLGIGFLYYHFNSNKDTRSLTNSIAKTMSKSKVMHSKVKNYLIS